MDFGQAEFRCCRHPMDATEDPTGRFIHTCAECGRTILDADQLPDIASAVTAATEQYRLLHEHIGRADTKAGLAATLQLATIGALTTLAQLGARPNRPGLLGVAVALLLGAVSSAGLVIWPRLGRPNPRDTAYFGALRTWSPAGLVLHLVTQPTAVRLHVLARQLVVVAQACWRKHRWLQRSLLCFGLAVPLAVLAYLP